MEAKEQYGGQGAIWRPTSDKKQEGSPHMPWGIKQAKPCRKPVSVKSPCGPSLTLVLGSYGISGA